MLELWRPAEVRLGVEGVSYEQPGRPRMPGGF